MRAICSVIASWRDLSRAAHRAWTTMALSALGTRTTSQTSGACSSRPATYYLTNKVFVDFDVRYRYMSKLVSDFGQGANTAETTLSVGYRF